MDWKVFYIQVLLISIALILNILATRRLMVSSKLNSKAKTISLILTWLIPFIWASLVLSFSDKPPNKTGKFDRNLYMDTGYPGP